MSAVVDSYIPPQSIEAEVCTLGSMFLSQRAVEQVLEFLNKDDFYRPAHRTIYEVIQQLAVSNKAVDLVTVKNELMDWGQLEFAGGVEYLIQVAESVPSPGNAMDYAQIVADKATLRRLEEAGHQITKVVHDQDRSVEEKVDYAESAVYSIKQHSERGSFQHVRHVAKEFFTKVDQLYETGTPILGAPSGFYDLDKMTGGLYGSDLNIVAARPSMGKTAFVLSFAINLARQNRGAVAVFSLEMSAEQLVRRMLSMISGVGMSVLKDPDLSDDQYHRLADACESLYSLPIHIDDNSDTSPLEMRGKCRRLKSENDGKLALVLVDYLQLMRGNRSNENRTQEISDIARGLKAIAKELDVPVIALSQLNRGVEQREDKRPMLSDIRESGSIEAEADIVMFIYRDEYYKRKEAGVDEPYDPHKVEEAEIIIAKHRNGPTGKVVLGFEPQNARFVNLKRY